MYIVTLNNWYLRGTVWTGDIARATSYETIDAAKATIAKAAKFNPKASKAARIVES